MKALATSALILVSLSNTDYSQKTSKHIRRVGLKASVQTAPRASLFWNEQFLCDWPVKACGGGLARRRRCLCFELHLSTVFPYPGILSSSGPSLAWDVRGDGRPQAQGTHIPFPTVKFQTHKLHLPD